MELCRENNKIILDDLNRYQKRFLAIRDGFDTEIKMINTLADTWDMTKKDVKTEPWRVIRWDWTRGPYKKKCGWANL